MYWNHDPTIDDSEARTFVLARVPGQPSDIQAVITARDACLALWGVMPEECYPHVDFAALRREYADALRT